MLSTVGEPVRVNGNLSIWAGEPGVVEVVVSDNDLKSSHCLVGRLASVLASLVFPFHDYYMLLESEPADGGSMFVCY